MKTVRLNSRFLEIRPMTAEQSGRGGCLLNIAYSYADTPFGEMMVATTHVGICYLVFVTAGRNAVLQDLKHIFPHAVCEQRMSELQQNAIEAVRTMPQDAADTIPLHLKATDFQLSVWKELLDIPLGSLTAYGKIAQKIQKPKACRAVGSAVGCNPVAVLIPCHRVVRTDGALGGYRWGLERKVKLLEWENTQLL